MEKTKYLFILSQRYSGSTLLSFLLGTHIDVSTIGERRKFYKHSIEAKENDIQTCSCGKLFTECEHWNKIKFEIQSRLDLKDYDTNPTEFMLFKNKHLQKLAYEAMRFCLSHKFPNPFQSKFEKLSLFNKVLVEETMKLDQGKVFLDSSKSIDHCFFLSLIEAFDFHVIWLTRDPRAQVNSAIKYNNWSIEEATNRWVKEMEDNSTLLNRLNINYTELKYELLCREPEKQVKLLLNKIGLDENGFSLDFRRVTQHIMGNYNMRLGEDTKIEERKEWQSHLNQVQIDEIEELTQNFQQYYSENY